MGVEGLLCEVQCTVPAISKYYILSNILPSDGSENSVFCIIIHSKYFPVSDWLKPHA